MRRQFGDSVSFARVSGLSLLGDRILVTDRLMSAHIATVHRWSGRIEHAGFHGEGPGEFRDPAWWIAESERPARAWLYDFKNRRFTLVEVDELGDRPGAWRQLTLDVGPALEQPVWTSSGLISNGLFLDYTLLVMDSAGRPVARIAADPPYTERHVNHPTGRSLINRTFLAVDPGRERLVLAYQFASRLDFFTLDGSRFGTVRGPRSTRPSYRIENARFFWNDDNEMAYWSVQATDHFVYALFCGCAIEDQSQPSRIHVFRWNGDFVTELELDRPIGAFVVTPDDSLLYAAFSEPYPAIGEWPLPAQLPASASREAWRSGGTEVSTQG